MKRSMFVLAVALAAAWTALAPASFAGDREGDDEEERIEIRTRVRRDDQGSGRGERGDREEGPRGRREGSGGRREHDPEMKEKFEKMRELEHKAHESAKALRQGSDEEKAAAKTEARKVLAELFDAKLAMDVAMLSKLEKHAAELKAKIAKKKAGREKAIDDRLARMAGDDDEW